MSDVTNVLPGDPGAGASTTPSPVTSPAAASVAPGRLSCGALVDDLLDQVADAARLELDPASVEPPDQRTLEHQQNCLHCRAMLAELREIWTPVSALVDQPVAVPSSLDRTVMERVSALAAHRWHAIIEENPGVTRIAAWVIAVIARRAAASVIGVATVGGRVVPGEPDVAAAQARYVAVPTSAQQRLAAGIGVAGSKVVVRVDIDAAGLPPSMPPLLTLAEQVRQTVINHVRGLIGLTVVEVDVHVADVRSLGLDGG